MMITYAWHPLADLQASSVATVTGGEWRAETFNHPV